MLRRIAGKGIVSHIRKDLISGHEAAWESIIATMHKSMRKINQNQFY